MRRLALPLTLLMPATPAADALLLLSTSCAHCAAVLASLAGLVKSGSLARLEVVNIAQCPEVAKALGVRSVPWLRIGDFELPGLRGEAELRAWAQRAASGAGMADYFEELLKHGELALVRAQLQRRPELLSALLPLVANAASDINARIGAGAIFEAQSGSAALRSVIPQLAALARDADARVRADACFYLGLSRSEAARSALEECLGDSATEVREIAGEALAELG